MALNPNILSTVDLSLAVSEP